MKIEYRDGNLLDSDLRLIAHGCNAKGVMGSGIALAIKERYPEAFWLYRNRYEESGLITGQVIPALCKDNRVVFNCITQATYGRDPNVRYVDYDGVMKCVQEINRLVVEFDEPGSLGDFFTVAYDREVGFPMIGAGLGNGDWHIIEAIIEEASTHFKPIVYRFKDKDV